MRECEIKNRRRVMDAALGRIACDLTIANVRLVNVLTGEIYPAEVDIIDGVVARVREAGEAPRLPSARTYDGGGRYLLPGFIDTHMHVESTMMLPRHLARAIVPWGTTTVCTDPHEIANVMGEAGVALMLEDARRAALRQFVLAPSCVPAVPELEGAGAALDAEAVGRILDLPGVIGVAEVMDYIGVVEGSPRMAAILEEGRRRGLFLQGHAPQASGEILATYRIAGPASDHESGSAAEVREKLRAGMRVNLRASSIIDGLDALTDGLRGMGWLDLVSICTDDVHASDLLDRGHINAIVRRLIDGGMDPLVAVKLCTLNAAQEYGFENLGAIAPGYMADMQLVDAMDGGRPHAVFIRGALVALEGRYVAEDASADAPASPRNTMNVAAFDTPEAFRLRADVQDGQVQVLVLGRTGEGLSRGGEWVTLPVRDGCVCLDDHPGLQFIAVFNRYGLARRTIAVTRDFGLTYGAIATTVSHDCHNLTVVYRDVDSALACLRALAASGGGMCAAQGGRCTEVLPLPVAGLMSLERVERLAPAIARVQAAMQALCEKPFSLLDVAVYALPVIPGLVVTDMGIVDTIPKAVLSPVRPAGAAR